MYFGGMAYDTNIEKCHVSATLLWHIKFPQMFGTLNFMKIFNILVKFYTIVELSFS